MISAKGEVRLTFSSTENNSLTLSGNLVTQSLRKSKSN